MAENALALMQYLSSAVSPLPSLTTGYSRPTTVFFSHLGHFFIYSFATAKWLYGVLFFASVAFVKLNFINPAQGKGVWWDHFRGSGFIFGGIIGSWLVANIVAAMMRFMGRGMSWFSMEYSPMALYGPPSLLGTLFLGLPSPLSDFDCGSRSPGLSVLAWPNTGADDVHVPSLDAVVHRIRDSDAGFWLRCHVLYLCTSTLLRPGS